MATRFWLRAPASAFTILLALLLAGCAGIPSPGDIADKIASGGDDEGTAASGVGRATTMPWSPRVTEPDPIDPDLLDVRTKAPWRVVVAGAPGAAPSGAQVFVTALGALRGGLVRAGGDGSFEVEVTSGPGDLLQVGLLEGPWPRGMRTHGHTLHQQQHGGPSTYVPVPIPQEAGPWSEGSVHVVGASPAGSPWRFDGGVQETNGIHVEGTLTILEPEAVSNVQVGLVPLFDATGEPRPGELFITTRTTPSGLPIEVYTGHENPSRVHVGCSAAQVMDPTHGGAACRVSTTLATRDVPNGLYAVALLPELTWHEGWDDDATAPIDLAMDGHGYLARGSDGVALSSVRVGAGAEPTWKPASMLLADLPVLGARGVFPHDASWSMTNRVMWQDPTPIIPRVDEAGQPIKHVLEPYLPQMLIADRDTATPPVLNPALPGGSWKVTVTDPSGATRELGPAPFAALVSRMPTTQTSMGLNGGGGSPSGLARLTTLDPSFAHVFTSYGEHTITTEGTFTDVTGRTYSLDHGYTVVIAQPLDVDLGTLPGTPLETGQPVNRGLQFHPPVPADLRFRFRTWAGPDNELVVDSLTEDKASAFGWFHDRQGHPVAASEEAGEYRVDLEASYRTEDGTLWAGRWTYGGVVVDPETALDVHGRRGIDTSHQETRFDRFFRSQTAHAEGGNHFNFPYWSGDVAWQTLDDSMQVRLTVADPDGDVMRVLGPAAARVHHIEPVSDEEHHAPDVTFRARLAAGQGALFSGTANGLDRRFTDAVDVEGYFYGTAERSGVRVRESIHEVSPPGNYWRFGDLYNLQPGMGPNGDLENDYKFLFGGAVLRDPARDVARTGGYGALWVGISDRDPTGSRVDSLFSTAAGPLWTFEDRAVQAFYEPTSVRAGSLLVVGDRADFGGYVVPMVDANLQVTITKPSGSTVELEQRANPWGHVHAGSFHVDIDEAGVWSVQVAMEACPAELGREPDHVCVTGGLNDGTDTYVFYAADGTDDAAGDAVFAIPEGSLTSRRGITNHPMAAYERGHATLWMPGWRLDSRALADSDELRYEPSAFYARFPNFDRMERNMPVDQVTVTAITQGADGRWTGFAYDAWGSRVFPAPSSLETT